MSRKSISCLIFSIMFCLCVSNSINANNIEKIYVNQKYYDQAIETIKETKGNLFVESYPSTRATINFKFKRDYGIAWVDDWVVVTYDNNKNITSSYGYQNAGQTWPNFSETLGINRVSASKTLHKWQGRKKMGALLHTGLILTSTTYTDTYCIDNKYIGKMC